MKNAECPECKQTHNIFVDACSNCGKDVSLPINSVLPGEENSPLIGSRWVREDMGRHVVYNGYTILATTNTKHKHPNHPEQVVYKGDNGHLWSLPLNDWPGSLIPELDDNKL